MGSAATEESDVASAAMVRYEKCIFNEVEWRAAPILGTPIEDGIEVRV